MWEKYPVSLHWRKIIFSSPERYELQITSALEIELYAWFLFPILWFCHLSVFRFWVCCQCFYVHICLPSGVSKMLFSCSHPPLTTLKIVLLHSSHKCLTVNRAVNKDIPFRAEESNVFNLLHLVQVCISVGICVLMHIYCKDWDVREILIYGSNIMLLSIILLFFHFIKVNYKFFSRELSRSV